MEAEKTCYFLQLLIVASSVYNRNNDGSIRSYKTNIPERQNQICNKDSTSSNAREEISQEIDTSSPEEIQETGVSDKTEQPIQCIDMFGTNQIVSSIDKHILNVVTSVDGSILASHDDKPGASRSIDCSITTIIQSALKIDRILTGFKCLWDDMHDEKEALKRQRTHIMREFKAYEQDMSNDPIKIRIQELDSDIADTRRRIDSIKHEKNLGS